MMRISNYTSLVRKLISHWNYDPEVTIAGLQPGSCESDIAHLLELAVRY